MRATGAAAHLRSRRATAAGRVTPIRATLGPPTITVLGSPTQVGGASYTAVACPLDKRDRFAQFAATPDDGDIDLIMTFPAGGCTPVASTQTVSVACTTLGMGFTGGTASQNQSRTVNLGDAGPGACSATPWVDTGAPDTSGCSGGGGGCSAPAGPFSQSVAFPCSNLGYAGGTAYQLQTRTYDSSQPSGVCPYTGWADTGAPDVSGCVGAVPCTDPGGPYARSITIACTSLGAPWTGGTATQAQTRSFDNSVAGPGICPFTAWVDNGAPDTSGCTTGGGGGGCTAPGGSFTQTRNEPCPSGFTGNVVVTESRTYDSSQPSGVCPYTPWTEDSRDSSGCTPNPCADPGGPYTRTYTEPCPAGFSGNVIVSEARSYDGSFEGPVCPFPPWTETGRDNSACIPDPPAMCGMGPMAGLILATDPTCCDFPQINDWVEDYRDDASAVADVSAQIAADPMAFNVIYTSYIGYDMDVHEEIVVGNAACAMNTQTRTRRNDYAYECVREGGAGTPITKCQVVAY